MRKIQSISSYIFIFAVAILTLVAVLGVWDILSGNVIAKSLQTFGLLGIITMIIIIAGRYINRGDIDEMIVAPDPGFKIIRQTTVTTLIASCSILALLGILTIWDVFTDKTILYRSLGSLGILAFSSFIIIMISLNQEKISEKKSTSTVPVGILILIILFVMMSLARFFN